jgi:hypothetical protein
MHAQVYVGDTGLNTASAIVRALEGGQWRYAQPLQRSQLCDMLAGSRVTCRRTHVCIVLFCVMDQQALQVGNVLGALTPLMWCETDRYSSRHAKALSCWGFVLALWRSACLIRGLHYCLATSQGLHVVQHWCSALARCGQTGTSTPGCNAVW